LIKEEPGAATLYYFKGVAHLGKGEPRIAKTAFAKAIELNPKLAVVHYHLGLVYHKKGEKDRAKEELKKALSLDQQFDGADEARQILSNL
jgi:Tfp pilus assembly protein PilF